MEEGAVDDFAASAASSMKGVTLMDDWNRLSFYGPPPEPSASVAASAIMGSSGLLLSASPGTASTLALLERKMLREQMMMMQQQQREEEGEVPLGRGNGFLPHTTKGANPGATAAAEAAEAAALGTGAESAFVRVREEGPAQADGNVGNFALATTTTPTTALLAAATSPLLGYQAGTPTGGVDHNNRPDEIVFTEEDLLKIKALRGAASKVATPAEDHSSDGENNQHHRTTREEQSMVGSNINRTTVEVINGDRKSDSAWLRVGTGKKREELSYGVPKERANNVPPLSSPLRMQHHRTSGHDISGNSSPYRAPPSDHSNDDDDDEVLLEGNHQTSGGAEQDDNVQHDANDGHDPEQEDQQQYEEEGGINREWSGQDKHFFILSDAGKPIYSRHGDEQKLCGLMGVMQGIFSFVSSSGDNIRTIYAGDHVMVFMARGPLYLLAIAKSGEPVSVLQQQLEYLHLQIISTITSGITKIFESRPCFDLRGLLRGSTKFIDNLVQGMDKRPSYLVNATQCLPLKPAIRNMTGTYLQGVKSEDLVYAMLIADGKLVNFVHPKKHPLHPEDLQLVLNFLESSGTFRTNETWVPICLPKFNDGGYLYAYLCYLDEHTCLVLISTVRNSEKFYELAEWKQKIDKSLRAAGVLEAIHKSVSRETYRVKDVAVPGLVSFLYRHNNLHQFTMPSPDPPYDKPQEQIRVLRRYQQLWAKVLERPSCGSESGSGHLSKHPHAMRQYWTANDRESSLVWVSPDVLLFILLEPWVSRAQAVQAAGDITRWIKSNESLLFILPSATQIW